MDEGQAAAQDLERIRSLMERAGRYSNLSGYSCFAAGLLAVAGALVCWKWGLEFDAATDARPLACVWGAVFVLALAQNIAFTIAIARRKPEPVWSEMARRVVAALLPGLFVGVVVTAYGVRTDQLAILPPLWMLAYGASLMGAGLFMGREPRITGTLFLIFGAAALFWWKEHGALLMMASFGGFHFLFGILILWRSRASTD